MSPEAQRIAIAEACGLGDYDTNMNGWHDESIQALPDYLTDLNAMHEAESLIRNAQDQMRYASETLKAMGFDYLMDASDLNVDYCWHAMGATASQRAEAFLRTINKWEASK